jgi:hypothetical protein
VLLVHNLLLPEAAGEVAFEAADRFFAGLALGDLFVSSRGRRGALMVIVGVSERGLVSRQAGFQFGAELDKVPTKAVLHPYALVH